jgi:starvation-inducible DNA-binding protein
MIDLYSQIKQAHWNVKGTRFYQPHDLFDRLVDEVRNHVDLTAERATALGGTALGTLRMSAASSRIAEYPLGLVDGRQHVEAFPTRFSRLNYAKIGLRLSVNHRPGRRQIRQAR